MKTLFSLISLLALFTSLKAATPPELPVTPKTCTSAKEFETVYKYLKNKDESFDLSQKQLMKLANRVSEGCTGASARFIKVTDLLVKAQMDSKSAIETALKFAPTTNEKTRAFAKIFIKGFVKEYLDLSLLDAADLADELVLKLDDHYDKALYDFEKIVRFCVRDSGIDFPKRTCATMARDVAVTGSTFKKSLGRSFIKVVEFLMDEDGPQIPAYQAVEKGKEIMKYGPLADDNFIRAYRFASDEDGLALPREEAVKFAITLAKRSVSKVK